MERLVEKVKKHLATKIDIDKPMYGVKFIYDGEDFISEPEYIETVDEFIDCYLSCLVWDNATDEEIKEILEENTDIIDELNDSYIANFDGEVFKHKTGFGYSEDEMVCYAFTDKKEFDKWLEREKELIPELEEYFE